jgi:CHAT domain-containing protein
MHRSGLALAGAQTTIEAWKRDEVPPVENDGILTVEDVSTLDLQGTWLVTLSACDTGSGEARAGEGVLGLRRGFIQAGAQNLLMTLWPISDEITVQIMSDFLRSRTPDRERSWSFSRGATQLAPETAHGERAGPSSQSCRAIHYQFSR